MRSRKSVLDDLETPLSQHMWGYFERGVTLLGPWTPLGDLGQFNGHERMRPSQPLVRTYSYRRAPTVRPQRVCGAFHVGLEQLCSSMSCCEVRGFPGTFLHPSPTRDSAVPTVQDVRTTWALFPVVLFVAFSRFGRSYMTRDVRDRVVVICEN